MAKKKRGSRCGAQAIREAGAKITSSQNMWANQLKQRQWDLKNLKLQLLGIISDARRQALLIEIEEKERSVADAERRLARCKKPKSRSSGYVKIDQGGRADGNR